MKITQIINLNVILQLTIVSKLVAVRLFKNVDNIVILNTKTPNNLDTSELGNFEIVTLSDLTLVIS